MVNNKDRMHGGQTQRYIEATNISVLTSWLPDQCKEALSDQWTVGWGCVIVESKRQKTNVPGSTLSNVTVSYNYFVASMLISPCGVNRAVGYFFVVCYKHNNWGM